MSVCLFLRVSSLCVRVCVTESVSVTVCLCVPVSACCLCLCFCRLAKSWNLLRGLTCRFRAVRRQVTARSRNDAQDIGKRCTEARCTEWGALGLGGAGAYRPVQPAWPVFTAPCGCGLQHRGPWGRSQGKCQGKCQVLYGATNVANLREYSKCAPKFSRMSRGAGLGPHYHLPFYWKSAANGGSK